MKSSDSKPKKQPLLFRFTSKKHIQRKSTRHSSRLLRFMMVLLLVLSAIWLCLLIWFHVGALSPLTWLAIIAIATVVIKIIISIFGKRRNTSYLFKRFNLSRRLLVGIYSAALGAGLIYFFSLTPQADRDWKDEVENILSYERDANNPNLVTLYNVRNFDWHTDWKSDFQRRQAINNDDFEATIEDEVDDVSGTEDRAREVTPHWETRQIDLDKLVGIDVINSYWMGPLIGHTLVTFRFEDDRPLAFSFEIRKEEDEEFSTLGGFFRKYELSLIASEERDIIYTRSNYRGEQVYLFPLDNLSHAQIRALFEHYLSAADDLNNEPDWYNTLMQNCTNIIFRLAREVDAEKFGLDYRIWLSGYVPNYLYDNEVLSNQPDWDIATWYKKAHINPKTQDFSEQDNLEIDAYSEIIRQDLPQPISAK